MTISVAGGQANGITYIMDGGTHNDPFNNLNLPTPFPDALQEFKVETSALPARYGHHAASAVNLVTKSGINQFHGDAVRVRPQLRFNARNFFAPTRDSLKRNQFGGTLGAPIVKNKLFFFGGYQGRDRAEQPADDDQLRADAGDAERRLHRIRVAGLQRRHAAYADRRLWRQPDRSVAPQPVSLNFLKHVPVSTDPCGRLKYGIPNNSTEHQGLGEGRLHDQQRTRRSSRAISTRSTTTRRPTTARTR